MRSVYAVVSTFGIDRSVGRLDVSYLSRFASAFVCFLPRYAFLLVRLAVMFCLSLACDHDRRAGGGFFLLFLGRLNCAAV